MHDRSPSDDLRNAAGASVNRTNGAPPLFTWPFVRLLIAQASFGFAFSGFFLFPKFIATELGGGATAIGIATAAYGIAAVVCLPLAGDLVDRFGRRRFLTGGAALMAIASLGHIGVDAVGPLLCTLRALQGVAFAMAFVGGATLAVDLAPRERLAHAIAMFGLSMLAMNAVAPALVEELVDQLGWPAAFAAAAGGAALCTLLSLRIPEAMDLRPHTATAPSLLDVLRRPRQLRIATVVALAGAAFCAMITYHQPFALELGMSHIRSFFVAYAVSAITVRLVLGPFVDRVGYRRVVIFALVLYVVVVLGMMRLSPALLPAFGAAFGLAHGLFYPALNALALEGARLAERGKVMALFQSAFHLGFAGASYPLGRLADHAGYPALFLAAGVCAVMALAVLVLAPDGRRTTAGR
jgi:MFS family permease